MTFSHSLYDCFAKSCHFALSSKLNQLYVYRHPLFFGFPCSLCHQRALNRLLCAKHQVLIAFDTCPACKVGDAEDAGLIPGWGRSPGGGHGNPLQCSCLENPHGERSLAGYGPWGHKGSDITERLSTAQHSVQMSIPISQFIPAPFPLGIHTFVLYVCVSVSAL